MAPRTRRTRTPKGYDLMGQPYYTEPGATPRAPALPTFTRETLPDRYMTRRQLEALDLTPGPAVARLRWSPVAEPCLVFNQLAARPTPPREEPDLFQACELDAEQEGDARGGSCA